MTPTHLQHIGAGLAILIGLNGLFRPQSMGRAVGLQHINAVGHVELRVLFGSFLVALPAYALWQGQVVLFEFFGVAALAAVIIKSSFTVIDKCPIGDIWFGILIDVVLAGCLLSSFLA